MTVGVKVYRDYDQAELDRQYSQATLVPDNSSNRAQKKAESERVRAKLRCILDVRYGPSPDETLDIFPAAAKGAPAIFFIHGGAWKTGNKNDVSYPAEAFVGRGITYIAVNFSLVPTVRLEEQVRQNRAAVAWIRQHAAEYGIDPERLYVSGHSSGGHVCGMVAVTDWQRDWGLPADTVKGVVPVSGMFDLEPVQLSYRNGFLKLTREQALALSPIRMIPKPRLPMVIGYGTGELDEFKRQSREMAEAWRAAGHPCDLVVLDGQNHYAGNLEFNNPDGPLLRAIFRMMGV
jgi:arylformamidase